MYGGLGGLLVDRATLVSRADRPVLTPDLAGIGNSVGVDPTLEGCALQAAHRRAFAHRRGSCSRTVDHTNWVVTLHSPEE
jgi:hypothetical protein